MWLWLSLVQELKENGFPKAIYDAETDTIRIRNVNTHTSIITIDFPTVRVITFQEPLGNNRPIEIHIQTLEDPKSIDSVIEWLNTHHRC